MNQSKSENFDKNAYIHLNLSTFQVKKKNILSYSTAWATYRYTYKDSLSYMVTNGWGCIHCKSKAGYRPCRSRLRMETLQPKADDVDSVLMVEDVAQGWVPT